VFDQWERHQALHILMDAAWDFALRRLWTASDLQRARATVRDSCAIKQCRASTRRAGRLVAEMNRCLAEDCRKLAEANR